jgi:hypothetical protein
MFAKIPSLSAGIRMLTKVIPLERGKAVERDGKVLVQ